MDGKAPDASGLHLQYCMFIPRFLVRQPRQLLPNLMGVSTWPICADWRTHCDGIVPDLQEEQAKCLCAALLLSMIGIYTARLLVPFNPSHTSAGQHCDLRSEHETGSLRHLT
jgi:hypothetical protein